MWCCFVHMQMCREYVQGVIALDKSLHILIEYPLGELAVLASGTHIRKVSHLEKGLQMKKTWMCYIDKFVSLAKK